MELRSDIAETLVAELDDGTPLLFRHIRPDDKRRLEEGFERLSPESRYRRFFRSIDRLTPDQLEYLTNVDGEDHVAWVALLRDEPGQPGVGVARWIRAADDPETAEAAVTVIDEYQGRRIGTTLLRLAAESAVSRGVKRFRVWTLGDNRPMLDLLERLGAKRGRWQSGVLEVNVDLPGDPDALDLTPAPLILKAVAAGEIVGETSPDQFGGTRLVQESKSPGDLPGHAGGAPDRT
jgi:GNAT superfamily N-acetyltransferase